MQTLDSITSVQRGFAGRRLLAIAVLIGGMGLGACEDDPVDPDEHDEGDVAGFRIEQIEQGGGRTVLLTYDGPENADTLVLPQGSSVDVEIVWLDDHGDEVDVHADEHDWQLAENHSAIVEFTQSDTEPWRGTFTTTPLLPGATVYGGYTVTLLHGADAEFTTTQLVAAVAGS